MSGWHPDYTVNRRIAHCATVGWRDAGVVSPSTPRVLIAGVADADTPDPAAGRTQAVGGPGHTPLLPGQLRIARRVAYRIAALVHDARGGYNGWIGSSAAICARAGYFESRGRRGNDYNGFEVGLTLIYRHQ